jgi:hypothetical protein
VAIELLGWTIKPDISIGDLAGIGALIASPLIFWAGYRRARRTEDIKTVSDLMNKIEKASREIMLIREELPPEGPQSKDRWLRQHKRRLAELQLNIRYLTVLKQNKEIKAKYLVDYCRFNVVFYLLQLDEHYTWFNQHFPDFTEKEIAPQYHAEVRYLGEAWKDEKISRWQKILGSVRKGNSKPKI